MKHGDLLLTTPYPELEPRVDEISLIDRCILSMRVTVAVSGVARAGKIRGIHEGVGNSDYYVRLTILLMAAPF